MDTTATFLDRLAAKHGNCSDYRLSKILGVQTSTIYHYRAGRSGLGDEVALKIAKELELPPAYVLACVMAERASAPTVRKVWADCAHQIATAGAVVLALALLIPDAAQAASVATLAYVTSGAPAGFWLELLLNQAITIYILCAKTLRRKTAHWRAAAGLEPGYRAVLA